jgi:hypothetical protein
MNHQLESRQSRPRSVSTSPSLGDQSLDRRLSLEQLEDRRLLAVFTVRNLNDAPVASSGDAPGTLRQAVFDANSQPGPDEILFADGLAGTILLTEGQLELTESATLTGPGAAQLTLQAFDPTPEDDNGDGNRVFLIDDGAAAPQSVSIVGLTLAGGDVGTAGGAILSLENLTITRSHITGNSASSTRGFLAAGGGIYINNANLVVEESTISNNLVYHDGTAIGGGIASGSGNVTITSSTITGNVARTPLGLSGGVSYGGGVAVGNGTHVFAHSTISNNRASGMDSFGGGIFAFGSGHSTTLDHTIVANSTGEFGRDVQSSIPVTLRNSLIEHDSDSLPFIDGGGNILAADPRLGNELIYYGGPTPTLGMRPDSPAIDQGNPLAIAGAAGVPQFDQRGAPWDRVADGDGSSSSIIDIGAVEYQTLPELHLIVDNLIDENDGNYSVGDLSLREAIGLSNGSVGFDLISFDETLSRRAIVLTRGQLRILDDLTIDATAGGMLIDAAGNDPTPDLNQGDGSRVFQIEVDLRNNQEVKSVELLGLHLQGGDVLGNGGAISSDENLQLIRTTIDGNFATQYGGGVDMSNSNAMLTVIESTLSHNVASGDSGNFIPIGFSTRGGGAIRLDGSHGEIISSTISGNRTLGANSDGGGVAAFSASLAIRHSTISGNSAAGPSASGGNIAFLYASAAEQFTLDHTIVANGVSETDQDIHSPSDPVLANNSLIEVVTGLTVNGSGNITALDPKLGLLAENGGRTRTHALLPGSAAIDGGAFAFSSPPDFDQRASPFQRLANGNGDAFTIVDIGAYERQTVAGLNLVVDLEIDENDGDYNAGDLSLREAIGLANGNIGNDVITFASNMLGKRILLSWGELQIVDDLVIDATSLGGRLTIDASGNDPTAAAPAAGDGSRVMSINDGDGLSSIHVELIGLTLTGGDILGNGGAIETTESLTVSQSTIFDNSALTLAPTGTGLEGAGGAIHVDAGGSLVINHSTLHKNLSDVGGGIAVGQGQLTLNSSTVSGNVVTSDGGGLWAAGASTAVTVNHSTIAANRAGTRGGGIRIDSSGGTITLNHSIVADNAADIASDDVSSVESVVFDHGWVEDGTGFTPTGGLQFIGVDPQLTALGDHGGTNLIHALAAGSPAIDAGNLFFAPPPANDQRGAPFVRVVDGNGDSTPRIDIGAYERQTLPNLNLLVDVVTDQVNGNLNAGDLSLREAVGLANGSLGADSIAFAPGLSGGTILLAQGQISITEDLVIDAMPLAQNVILDASGSDPTSALDNGDGSRLLFISDNASANLITVMIGGLELTGGDAERDGGAIFSTENLEIRESTIAGNAAFDGKGGGIMAIGGGLMIANSTVSGNRAVNGGGIGIQTANLTVVNSTVSGNEADTRGGGIYGASGAAIEVRHSTFSDNRASSLRQGGGIYVAANVNLSIDHTIVANNQAGNGPDISAAGTVSLTHSLVEDSNGFTSVGSPNITGQDPNLGPLSDNGGPTQTHALLEGSAAIDAGEFGITSPPDFDQRGAPFHRVVANLGAFEVIDIGAFEVQVLVDSADFDTDNDIDGSDFLAWQRGFGTTPAAKADGDADNDADVDGDDFSIWQNQFGQPATPLVATGRASSYDGEPQLFLLGSDGQRLDAALVDAAMAWEWLGAEEAVEDISLVNRPDSEMAAARRAGEEPGDSRSTSRVATETTETTESYARSDESDAAEDAWLTDEILESVFR